MAQTVCVVLSAAEREQLAAIAADRNRPRKHVERARIVLASADRHSAQRVAHSVGVSRPTVWRWQQRFAESGVDGLLRDKTRKPGKTPIAAEITARVVALTPAFAGAGSASNRRTKRPTGPAARWPKPPASPWVRCNAFGGRTNCSRTGCAPSSGRAIRVLPPSSLTLSGSMSIRRPMRSCCRSTKRARSKRSTAPSPGLPLKPGRCQTMTHDYKRHGTTTLLAALSVLDGAVIGRCMQRHRHLEFIRFLNAVEREINTGRPIHVVLDNYATHKHPKVLAWLARHPRWTFHFTPTSASWLNAVENFFSKMTRQRIRRGVFHSIADLQTAINAYLAEHNASPKPFVWTKSAKAILAKLDRCPVLSV
jgi:transposase